MFSQKLFRLAHKIALFAILFASLAPSISHALAAQQGRVGFLQEICVSKGKKLTIQIATSKGQPIATEFAIKTPANSPPANINHHLEHCPFCSAGAIAALIPANHLTIIALLEVSAQKAAEYATPIAFTNTYQSPPSHAPPAS